MALPGNPFTVLDRGEGFANTLHIVFVVGGAVAVAFADFIVAVVVAAAAVAVVVEIALATQCISDHYSFKTTQKYKLTC